MTVEEKIGMLGDAFRGLWKSYELQSDAEWKYYEHTKQVKQMWCLTFLYKDMMVETPLFDRIHEPLDFAIEKLGLVGTEV